MDTYFSFCSYILTYNMHIEGASIDCDRGRTRMNAYSFDGLIVVALLLICSCAYLKRIPRINQLLLSEKKGFFGIGYKAAVVGTRLHHVVSIACLSTAFYALFLR
ncbi:hypothetical protein PRIPAC_91791 [Pristionchus pacificus]|uniref:Protein kish-B n=1 Tax=Pristionchus pacificus TaxID=54126 RepID=A0A2A6BAP8_PRIPA|nr:hypothetical protein PRIPAC_91791 [Pristionchus pacificus]|eukprot:PDM62965.1 hypothetical protein PRIPAC_50180 [Pristionchus pacificus]